MKKGLYGILVAVISGIILIPIEREYTGIIASFHSHWRSCSSIAAFFILFDNTSTVIVQVVRAIKYPEDDKYPIRGMILLCAGWLLFATTCSYMYDYHYLLKSSISHQKTV